MVQIMQPFPSFHAEENQQHNNRPNRPLAHSPIASRCHQYGSPHRTLVLIWPTGTLSHLPHCLRPPEIVTESGKESMREGNAACAVRRKKANRKAIYQYLHRVNEDSNVLDLVRLFLFPTLKGEHHCY